MWKDGWGDVRVKKDIYVCMYWRQQEGDGERTRASYVGKLESSGPNGWLDVYMDLSAYKEASFLQTGIGSQEIFQMI